MTLSVVCIYSVISCKIGLLELGFRSHWPLTEATCTVDMRHNFAGTPAPCTPICDMGAGRVLARARDVLLQIFARALPVTLAVPLVWAENEQCAEPTQRHLRCQLWQLVDFPDGCAIVGAHPIGEEHKAVTAERVFAAWKDAWVQ